METGMDFFACILVKTERSQEELRDCLNNQKFIPAKNHEIGRDRSDKITEYSIKNKVCRA